MKFGEYLIGKNKINNEQLEKALQMQVDNTNVKLGELLVFYNYLEKEDLMNEISSYVRETGATIKDIDEWLTQEEADKLIDGLKH